MGEDERANLAFREQENVTRLSKRDRDILLSLLDDQGARLNRALAAAAGKFKGGDWVRAAIDALRRAVHVSQHVGVCGRGPCARS